MDFDPRSILVQGYRSLPDGNSREVWLLHYGARVNEVLRRTVNTDPHFRFSRDSKCVTKGNILYVFGGQGHNQEGNMNVRRIGVGNLWHPRLPLGFSLRKATLAVAGDNIYLLPYEPYSLLRAQNAPENVAYIYNTENGHCDNINRPPACVNCVCNGSTEEWHPHFSAAVEGGLLATTAEGNSLFLHKYDLDLQTWTHWCDFQDIPRPDYEHEHAVYGSTLFFSFSKISKITVLYVIDVTTRAVLQQYEFELDSIWQKQKRFLVALSHNRVCYFCYDRNKLYITRLILLDGDFEVELQESVQIEVDGLLSCILWTSDFLGLR